MRLRSEIWVQAYIRRVMGAGAAAYVMRRGDPNAGSIMICVSSDAGMSLLVPALAPDLEDAARSWQEIVSPEPGSALTVKDRLEREASYDPDIWVVEIEDRAGRHFLGEELSGD